MERTTRAIGTMATAERKGQPTTTQKPADTQGPIEGTVQRGKPVGAVTTRDGKALIKDGR